MAEPAQVGVVRFGAQQHRRRKHNDDDPRVHRVTVRLSTEELAAVDGERRAARMATSAYLAEAGIAPLVPAADGPDGPQRPRAAGRTDGSASAGAGSSANLNQAVARLHATGEPAGDLAASAAYVARIAARVDELVTAIAAAQTGRR